MISHRAPIPQVSTTLRLPRSYGSEQQWPHPQIRSKEQEVPNLQLERVLCCIGHSGRHTAVVTIAIQPPHKLWIQAWCHRIQARHYYAPVTCSLPLHRKTQSHKWTKYECNWTGIGTTARVESATNLTKARLQIKESIPEKMNSPSHWNRRPLKKYYCESSYSSCGSRRSSHRLISPPGVINDTGMM